MTKPVLRVLEGGDKRSRKSSYLLGIMPLVENPEDYDLGAMFKWSLPADCEGVRQVSCGYRGGLELMSEEKKDPKYFFLLKGRSFSDINRDFFGNSLDRAVLEIPNELVLEARIGYKDKSYAFAGATDSIPRIFGLYEEMKYNPQNVMRTIIEKKEKRLQEIIYSGILNIPRIMLLKLSKTRNYKTLEFSVGVALPEKDLVIDYFREGPLQASFTRNEQLQILNLG